VTIRIRLAADADLPATLTLWRAADAEPTHTDDLASLRRLVHHDPGALLLAEDGTDLVGTVIAGWDGWRGSIYRLVVGPRHRRRGIGRQLVEAADSRLAVVGALRSQATVVGSDAQATTFWKATGWEQQSDRLRFVKG
jgi:ribosomal protein S18 acetylase RimI-like enzyme